MVTSSSCVIVDQKNKTFLSWCLHKIHSSFGFKKLSPANMWSEDNIVASNKGVVFAQGFPLPLNITITITMTHYHI